MRNVYLNSIILICFLFILTGCCTTFHGYGRYTMKVDCDKTVIDGVTYKITRHGGDLVVAGHTLPRGIYRKTRPWLYLHHVEGDKIDITFEAGSKDIYPLYTGSSASIFDVYAKPWGMTRSTNAMFSNNYWLVSHRWSSTGIFFDLQKMAGDVTSWQLVRGDIFVPADGTEIEISEINTKVKIISFDAAQKKALVRFTVI